MKVLLLHQHFNTPDQGGAVRSYYLAKALVDKGITPVVFTGCNEKKYRLENYEGIEIHYLPVAYKNAFGFVARSVAFLKYVRLCIKLANKTEGIDICYAISAPLTVGLAAVWLKRRFKLPFIFEVGDLWPDAPVQMGFVKNYFLVRALFQLEKYIYQQAESIVALSLPIRDAIDKKAPGKKIHVIPNMSDCVFYTPQPKDVVAAKKFDAADKFVVSYIGTIGVANGLEYFIDCANTARKARLPVHFILCGDGAALPPLQASAKKLSLENISFTGLLNRAGVREVMNITDAVFVSYKNLPILQTGSPNKYFDGLAAGKLIILNFGGWIKNEIEKTGCGIYVNPLQPSDFVTRITPFLHDRKKTSELQRAARALAESNYSRQKISDQFAAIFCS